MEQQPTGDVMLSYATPSAVADPSKRGKGFLAAAASFVIPGLGQALAGHWKRGLWWFVAAYSIVLAAVALMALRGWILLGLVVLTPLNPIVWIAGVIDAYLTGNRRGGRMLGRPWARYVAGVVALAAGVAAAPQVLLMKLVRPYWAETYVMPTASMNPTIVPGDRFLVSKQLRTWRRWDVVAMIAPDNAKVTYCKRIAGLPGETIEIRNGVVHVNGNPVPSPPGIGPYTNPGPMASHGTEGHPITLGPGEYYMLGDNSPISADSRYWASPTPEASLLGHVTAIYWPIKRARIFD